MMQEQATIMEELREIENVLEINGCFLLRANDNAIIESTIPLKIHNDILWEIAVLRETFQQFATGLQHGLLNDITLEGDRGFIFIYNLPPNFILLAMGPSLINLAYVKIGMIDILNRIKDKLEKIGESLLTAPVKEFAVVGAEAEKAIPKLVTAPTAASPHMQSEAFMEARAKAEARAAGVVTAKPVVAPKLPEVVVTPVGIIPIEPEFQPETVPTPVEPAPVIPTPVEPAPVVSTTAQPSISIPNTVLELKGKSQKDRNRILSGIFDQLKIDIKMAEGAEIAATLDLIKDAILENFGTSLALFDISRNARDFKNVHTQLAPQQVLMLRERIANWAQRIIK